MSGDCKCRSAPLREIIALSNLLGGFVWSLRGRGNRRKRRKKERKEIGEMNGKHPLSPPPPEKNYGYGVTRECE